MEEYIRGTYFLDGLHYGRIDILDDSGWHTFIEGGESPEIAMENTKKVADSYTQLSLDNKL